MEKKDNTFNYMEAKMTDVIYSIHHLRNSRLMKYSEFITLGTITCGVALNAKCINAKRNKLFVPGQKCVYTTLTNFSTIYLVMCKVYTDVGGIK